MDINRVIKPGSILLGCALLVGNVQANTVFTGSVSGYFNNPIASRSDYTNINNNSTGSVFNWGLTSRHGHDKHSRNRGQGYRSNRNRGQGYRSPKSSNFEFESIGSNSAASAFSVSADQIFSLGDFTYSNEATYFSQHVEGVDFTLSFELDGYGSSEFTYMLNILNTSNSSSNSSDFISLLNSVSSQSLQFGNDWYELAILGFSRDGGVTFETSAWLDEGLSTKAGIYAQFNTVSAVPVPAAAWLFGSGFLWLAALARKPMNRKR